jgi:hypothetical protein
MLFGDQERYYVPSPQRSVAMSEALTDVESGRTSLESNPEEGEGFDSNWFNELFLPTADFDLSSTDRYSKTKSDLVRLKTEISERTSFVAVKVPRDSVYELAKYVNESGWVGGCESSLDYLFFEAPQSAKKGQISGRLFAEIEAAGPEDSACSQDAILPIGNRTKAPDVVFWRNGPTDEQLLHPLAQASLCPLPNLWIELFINVTEDRSKALDKIRDFVIPNCGATCAVLAIGIPSAFTEAMRRRIRKSEPTIEPTTPAEVEEGGRPLASPYVGYWPLDTTFVDGRWYRIQKNRHIEVVVANDFTFRFEFNSIIRYL